MSASRPDVAADDLLRADLGWALGVVYRAYLRAATGALGSLPGGPRGHQVLAAATRTPPMSQRAIAAEIGVDRTVLTYLIDDLEQAGLVTRTPDPADRRSRRIVATTKGARRLDEVDALLGRVQDHLLADVAESDRTTLRDLLRQVAQRIDSADPMGACDLAVDIAARTTP